MNPARATAASLFKRLSQTPLLPTISPNTRPFHTSSRFLAARDTSSIDSVNLPSAPSPLARRDWISVPYLPSTTTPYRAHSVRAPPEIPDAVIRAEISTAALPHGAAGGPSAMSDVTDNAAMGIDPYELTDAVRSSAAEAGRKLGLDGDVKRAEEDGVVRQIWRGMVDDVLGVKRAGGAV